MNARQPSARRRRGTMTAELMWVFPILAVMLFGMIQTTAMLEARLKVAAASREGARIAALGGSHEEVEDMVRRQLGAGRLKAAAVSLTTGVEPFEEIAGGADVPSGEPLALEVSVPTIDAVPNLLQFVGFQFHEERIAYRTIMRRE